MLRDRSVLYAAGYDKKFIFLQEDCLVAQFHLELAFDDIKHFIFMLMFMPDKFALEFDKLDVLTVELACDAGIPVIVDEGKFFREIYFFHGVKYIYQSCV